MIFIILASLLVLFAVVVLIYPLLKTKSSDSYERDTQNIHYARERLAELEQQLSTAEISAADYEALKLEIESTLMADIGDENEQQPATQEPVSTSNAVVITLLCCLIPFSALATYLLTGTPTATELNGTAVNAARQEQTPTTEGEVNDLLGSLEKRLEQQPDDEQGWTILARSYQQLGRYDEATEAYSQLVKLQPDNADVHAGLADVMALSSGGLLAGQPTVHIEKALELDPNHPQAHWLAGLAQAQLGNNDLALNYWRKLEPMLADYPQQQEELAKFIKEAEANMGITSDAPTEQASEVSSDEADEIDENRLLVSVSLDPSLVDKASATDTVFVIAKAETGPPAPLAVKRIQVQDLPTELSLSAADAMLPQLSIDQFESLLVTARISKSGQPIAQPGDLQSQEVSTKNSNKEQISLSIDRLVP